MANHLTEFWENFRNKHFSAAQAHLDALSEDDKQGVLAELFQKSEYHRKPVMISLLRRELHEDKSFNDFYHSWLPTEAMSNKIEQHGQIFQQHFPVAVRVLNGINAGNSKDIISVGITWVANDEEEKGLWEYMQQAGEGEDANNEARHDKIQQVAEGELLGIFRVETDDNLGTPF